MSSDKSFGFNSPILNPELFEGFGTGFDDSDVSFNLSIAPQIPQKLQEQDPMMEEEYPHPMNEAKPSKKQKTQKDTTNKE